MPNWNWNEESTSYNSNYETPLTKVEVHAAWEKGKKMGQGVYGEVKLVSINNRKYVAKKFLDENQFSAARNKREEENKHFQVWNRLNDGCKKYFCEPIKSPSSVISLQVPAGDDHHTVKTLKDFVNDKNIFKTLGPKLSAFFHGLGTPRNYSHLRSPAPVATALNMLIADALRCMHMSGVVHGDVKWDNLLVVYTLKNGLIDTLQVKIIDMGLAALSEKKSLVRTRKNNRTKLNTKGLQNTLEKQQRKYNPEGGFFGNNTWIVPFETISKMPHKYKDLNRPRIALKQRQKVQLSSLPLSTHYTNAVRGRENAAAKLIQKQVRKASASVRKGARKQLESLTVAQLLSRGLISEAHVTQMLRKFNNALKKKNSANSPSPLAKRRKI